MNRLTLHWYEAGQERSYVFDVTDSSTTTIRLGRDPDHCHVLFTDPRISRIHGEISWQPREEQFHIQNLRESNPILLDYHPVATGDRLHDGSLLVLGETRIRVSLTVMANHSVPALPAPPVTSTASAPIVPPIALPIVPPALVPEAVVVPAPTHSSDDRSDIQSGAHSGARSAARPASVTLSQFLPLVVSRQEIKQTRYLVPGILTVIWVVLLFSSLGQPVLFNGLLALYIGVAGFYFIYRICEKRKPWWVISLVAIATPILLVTPVWPIMAFVFRSILPGQVPDEGAGFLAQFVAFFFGAGLAEELLKALPLFALQWYSQGLSIRQRDRIGITEPLDGIILGAASGLGFTLLETLGQYVPDLVSTLSSQFGQGAGELLGLQLLIPRVVGSVFGHMAYSGCFGYYIGLSSLKPKRRWQFLSIGWLVSATIHALWNASGLLGNLALGLAGILAYCLLTGAVLKARQLTPKPLKT